MWDFQIKLASKLSSDEWKSYLKIIGNYTIYHLPELIKYYESTNKNIKDFSYFCFEKKKPIAFVSLALTVDQKKILSYGEMPCHLPAYNADLNSNTKKKLLDSIYKKIFLFMKEEDVDYADFHYHPAVYEDINPNKININYKDSFSILKFFDLTYVTINTNIINLENSNKELLSNLQNRMRKEFNDKFYKKIIFKIINNKNTSESVINEYLYKYKNIHFKAAKKKTRDDKSWELMLDSLLKGNSSLFTIEIDTRIISCLWCIELKNLYAYGGSQANVGDEEFLKFSVRSFLEWNVINYYKTQSYKYYEIGQTYFYDRFYKTTSEKHKRIGLLKTKFGGDLYPRHYFRIHKEDNNFFND